MFRLLGFMMMGYLGLYLRGFMGFMMRGYMLGFYGFLGFMGILGFMRVRFFMGEYDILFLWNDRGRGRRLFGKLLF